MSELSKLGKAAVAYASRGYKVFPLKVKDKAPATRKGFKDGTTKLATIRNWWRENPDYNIGIATGDGLLVLDIDGPTGGESLREFEDSYGPLPATPFQVTGKGRHYLFACEDEALCRNSASTIGEGIDTRGNGGYIVVAPSVHPGGHRYRWDDDHRPSKLKPAPAPKWLLDRLTPKISEQASVERRPLEPGEVSEKYVEAALDSEYEAVCNAANGTRNTTLNTATFNLGTLVGAGLLSESRVVADMEAAAAACNLPMAEARATISSALRAGMAKPRTVELKERRAAGGGKEKVDVVKEDRDTEDTAQVFTLQPRVRWLIDDWREQADITAEGTLRKQSTANAGLFLRYRSDLAGLFAYDEFSQSVMVTRKPPWAVDGYKPSPKGTLQDADVTRCVMYLEQAGIYVGLATCAKIIEAVAAENSFNRVLETLEALEWDGTERLDHFLIDYFGAKDTNFTRQAGAKWLISAVARVFNPGCKADCMLVLEGKQGIRKSSALRALCDAVAPHTFSDRLSDLKGKDAVMDIQGRIIVELAELDALRSSDVSTIKAFLSRDTDKVRLPYARTTSELPRQCVFAGTVNPGGSGWISDTTGARRFWPILCGERINIVEFKDVASQLWAEAVERFKNKEPWWLTDEVVIAEAEDEASDRFDEDPWSELIDTWLGKQLGGPVHVNDILKHAIELPKDKWTRREQMRISNHLKRLGYVRRREMVSGDRGWRWYPPED